MVDLPLRYRTSNFASCAVALPRAAASQVDNFTSWLEGKKGEQGKLAAHEDPAFKSEDVHAWLVRLQKVGLGPSAQEMEMEMEMVLLQDLAGRNDRHLGCICVLQARIMRMPTQCRPPSTAPQAFNRLNSRKKPKPPPPPPPPQAEANATDPGASNEQQQGPGGDSEAEKEGEKKEQARDELR